MTISSFPPNRLSDACQEESGCQSGVLDIGLLSVGFLVGPGSDGEEVAAGIAEAGLLAIEARTLSELVAQMTCRLFVVDAAIATAADSLRRLSRSRSACSLLVLVGDQNEEVAALRAGASAALRKPVGAALVAWHLARIKDRATRVGADRDTIELEATRARAESVQHLAAAITHEMAAPLSVVLTNADILRDQLRQDQESGQVSWRELDEMTGEIANAAKRVKRNVGEMRSLARAGALPPVRTRLSEAARSAIPGVPNPRQAPIALQVASDEYALALPDLLRHVLENLIANALHAVREVPRPQVIVRVYAQNGEARISVRDNGPGVPVHLRDRIFEPFFTTKGEEGMGMGLALCRELVARMGGALTLSSAGGGACFRVRLRPV
jgi:signal transduction histidine kinase